MTTVPRLPPVRSLLPPSPDPPLLAARPQAQLLPLAHPHAPPGLLLLHELRIDQPIHNQVLLVSYPKTRPQISILCGQPDTPKPCI